MQKITKMPQYKIVRNIVGVVWMAAAFMGIEIFMRCYVCADLAYPLAFSALWAVLLTAFVLLFPTVSGKILFGLIYYVFLCYAVGQSVYYMIFGKMMWLTDIQYAGEGATFADSVFSFLTPEFYALGALLIAVGAVGVVLVPVGTRRWYHRVGAAVGILLCSMALRALPQQIFKQDEDVWGGDSEYRRALSLEGIYTVMYDARKVYRICGLYQYTMRDVYNHFIVPHTPAYAVQLKEDRSDADAYFEARGAAVENDMTGLFEGKNVIIVLMESMDDWMVNEDLTPVISSMMDEGINFTNLYTPGYGGVRTFNTEFCVNTGMYLPTDGNLAFSYCTNDFSQSLPSLLRARGYSAASFHYNQAIFYNRGVMHPAIGYEEYVSYYDYVPNGFDPSLLDDCFQFNNETVRNKFFGGDSESDQFCSFLITRSAHMPYTYDDELSQYALARYPEFQSKTGNEELDCIQAKAKLLDDMFAELKEQLEESEHLDDTVIVAFGDHYAYGMTDQDLLFQQSGVEDKLLIEKTPCFIWANNMEPIAVTKTLNTADILPTILNLFGIQEEHAYLGRDAFDDNYAGYAIFADGSWITDEVLYQDGTIVEEFYSGASADVNIQEMNETAQRFININNLLLKSNYYASE